MLTGADSCTRFVIPKLAERVNQPHFPCWSLSMSRFPELSSWLTIELYTTVAGRYEHALASKNGNQRCAIVVQSSAQAIPRIGGHANGL
jgi:hypothetical protein